MAPILDYEHDGPDELAQEYDDLRPDFSQTGSPRLPVGLNLGAQIFWLFETFPHIKAATKQIVTYPQYWVARLTGIAVNEATSLGCHTDLWNPVQHSYSTLVTSMGWEPLMAPLRQPGDLIGAVRADIAISSGLKEETPVYCGIHDSNASLYPHLLKRRAPFFVVSSGTWVVCMAMGGPSVELDPNRDTLINVNGLGQPVRSSRFMGGREFDLLIQGYSQTYEQSDIDKILVNNIMLLPSVESRSGPFQGKQHHWINDEHPLSDGERFSTVSFYLALMTATCLDLIGAAGEIIVEGPFSKNRLFVEMLSAATGRNVVPTPGTGTSAGAALLVRGERNEEVVPTSPDVPSSRQMVAYASTWMSLS